MKVAKKAKNLPIDEQINRDGTLSTMQTSAQAIITCRGLMLTSSDLDSRISILSDYCHASLGVHHSSTQYGDHKQTLTKV